MKGQRTEEGCSFLHLTVGSPFQLLPKERCHLENYFTVLLQSSFSSPVCIINISTFSLLRKSSCGVRVSWQSSHLKGRGVLWMTLLCVPMKKGIQLFFSSWRKRGEIISPNSTHCYTVKLKISMTMFISKAIWCRTIVIIQEFSRIVLFFNSILELRLQKKSQMTYLFKQL